MSAAADASPTFADVARQAFTVSRTGQDVCLISIKAFVSSFRRIEARRDDGHLLHGRRARSRSCCWRIASIDEIEGITTKQGIFADTVRTTIHDTAGSVRSTGDDVTRVQAGSLATDRSANLILAAGLVRSTYSSRFRRERRASGFHVIRIAGVAVVTDALEVADSRRSDKAGASGMFTTSGITCQCCWISCAVCQ